MPRAAVRLTLKGLIYAPTGAMLAGQATLRSLVAYDH